MDAGRKLQARQELDEVVLAFRITRRERGRVDGWLRMVRLVVGVTARDLGERMGIKTREVFRLETMEMSERISLGRLRKAADALGCELVYGLVPREGTMEDLAARENAAREKARTTKRLDKRLRELRLDSTAGHGRTAMQKAARRVLRKIFGIQIRKEKELRTDW